MSEKKLNINEAKFRSMVSDLMTMKEPRMVIEVNTASRARNLRRMFYIYGERIAEYERKFLANICYKLQGSRIIVELKAQWQPKEISTELGSSNVSSD